MSRHLRRLLSCAGLLITLTSSVSAQQLYRDIRPNHWLWNGSDPVTVEHVVELAAASQKTGSSDDVDLPGSEGERIWQQEFVRLGKRFEALAQEQEKLGLNAVAAELYQRASANFALAKYPLISPSPLELDAYAFSLRTLHRAHELRGFKVEYFSVPYAGGIADGHILYPFGEPPKNGWPLVIASNGIDVNQGEFFSFAEEVAERGIAFLMFDIAGTGTNAEFPLTPDYDAIPQKFAETLREEPSFDPDRFAIMGVSFGGNAAVKLAHTRPDLFKAAVNVCGPLHVIFELKEEDFGQVGLMYRLALFDRTHLRQDQVSQLIERLRGFSLVKQGVLIPGQTKTRTPILSVNARGDYVAPEEDMELANSSTVDGTLIYSGEDDHCPQDRFSVMPQIVTWLAEKLHANTTKTAHPR